MCGIFGIIEDENPLTACLEGLEKLEYRGYDSTGIAGIKAGKLVIYKEPGKISQLKQNIALQCLELAIGHTRWATHGKVSKENTHPHVAGKIALVHNGIIENYLSLKEELKQKGVFFSSETDSEVIVQLVNFHFKGDLCEALQKTLPLLKGTFALALIHQDNPHQIVAAARESPLAIGFNDQKTKSIISSDPNAFLGQAFHVFFLHSDEIASVSKGKVQIFDRFLSPVTKQPERFEAHYETPSKGEFKHFMLKEIYEQPSSLEKAMQGRSNIHFEPFGFTEKQIRSFRNIWILGCGSSAHAGSLGAMYFEDLAKIPANAEIASEARYRDPLLGSDTLIIGISQSGETADTLAALREAKKQNCPILGICNVHHATLTREADASIFLKAGPEISVCSTKAFSSQLAVLYLLALHFAYVRGALSSEKADLYFDELKKVPKLLQEVISKKAPLIENLAQKYARYKDFFFIGRRYMFQTALEAALKLKEVAYVNANGLPAGELKHGSLALINPEAPVIALCSHRKTQSKILSNLMEIKARGGPILAFAPEGFEEVASIADDVLWLPETNDELSPFISTMSAQLLAYHIANIKGCEVDQPRNLAKSVTVE